MEKDKSYRGRPGSTRGISSLYNRHTRADGSRTSEFVLWRPSKIQEECLRKYLESEGIPLSCVGCNWTESHKTPLDQTPQSSQSLSDSSLSEPEDASDENTLKCNKRTTTDTTRAWWQKEEEEQEEEDDRQEESSTESAESLQYSSESEDDERAASPLSVEDLQEFAMRAAPEEEVIQCRITRDRSSFYPVYYLHMEREDGENVFLMAARKRKKCRTSNYVISTDYSNLSRKASGYIGKLRSNLLGTKYTVYDCGENPEKTNWKGSEAVRQELAAVSYERSDHGFWGPRKMKVVIPGIQENDARVSIRPKNKQETLLMRLANDDTDQLISLQSKSPSWDDQAQVFSLDFNERVKEMSEKNFQLVHPENEDYVVMQFGRVSEDVFTMDYSFPMCAFQAFAIALSSFDGKLPFGEVISSWTKGTQKSYRTTQYESASEDEEEEDNDERLVSPSSSDGSQLCDEEIQDIEDDTDWKREGTASPGVLSPLSTPRHKPTGSEPNLRSSSPLFVDDLHELAMCPAPREETIKCRITRDQSNGFPVYQLHTDGEDGENVFLMAARKKTCKTSYYLISTDPTNESRKARSCIGKLRSNFLGTKFTVYDSGENPEEATVAESEAVRQELASICYEANVLGMYGPRKMRVVIPGILENDARVCVRPINKQETLVMRQANNNMDQLITLQSKSPIWNDQSESYTLDFGGRATLTSVKNFQLVHPDNEDYVVMQCGRVSEDVFTLDYSFPMCAFQAFAIALSSLDGKLACE
ncbi:uncharacterized protein ACBR49_018099 [Aulostomus maculatus]